jgi:hypothetical protein
VPHELKLSFRRSSGAAKAKINDSSPRLRDENYRFGWHSSIAVLNAPDCHEIAWISDTISHARRAGDIALPACLAAELYP